MAQHYADFVFHKVPSLADVKVGDRLAPVMRSRHGHPFHWGGMIYAVQHVTAKRFEITGYKINKATATEVGSGSRNSAWVRVTTEMQTFVDERRAAEKKQKEETEAFDSREDVILARRIQSLKPLELIAKLSTDAMKQILGEA